MSYTVFFLTSRKSGLSPEKFKDHYENKHLPLVIDCLKDFPGAAPLSHTRYYLRRGENDVPMLIMGDASTVDYDCLTLIEFRDEHHFGEFNQAWMTSPKKAELDADAETFGDFSKFRILAVESGKTTKF
jgi:hypothetical protein